jgi:hypothetical protein
MIVEFTPNQVNCRFDYNASHNLLFHHIESLVLQQQSNLDHGHMKGIGEYVLVQMFGPDMKVLPETISSLSRTVHTSDFLSLSERWS